MDTKMDPPNTSKPDLAPATRRPRHLPEAIGNNMLGLKTRRAPTITCAKQEAVCSGPMLTHIARLAPVAHSRFLYFL